MRHKHRKHFSITLMASFSIHLLALTILFKVPDPGEQDGYKRVRVRLGVKNQFIEDPVVSARKYTEFSPGAGQVQNNSGNGSVDLPEITASPAISSIQELQQPQEQLKEEASRVDGTEVATVTKDTVIERSPEIAMMPEQVAQKAVKKSVEAHPVSEDSWDEDGVVIGNATEKTAGKLASYEQMLPLWLEKFKRYPEEARNAHMVGVGEVFIKIDRKGKVLLSKVIKSTGYQTLDRAIMKMVADADPVLPVPLDYHPDRKAFSYKVAVSFEE